MASFVNRDTNVYVPSGNTPDFPDPPWLKNPDVRLVLNEQEQIPTQFWIVPQLPDTSIVITADRVEWKRSLEETDLSIERQNRQDGEFHFALSGDHMSGETFLGESDDMEVLVFIINALTSGIPVPELEDGTIDWVADDGTVITLTDSDLINFHGRFQETREQLRVAFFDNFNVLEGLTTEQEIDDFTPIWPEI